MGFDYKNLKKCEGCTLFEKGDDRTNCAIYWRPGTGTKTGFPMENGWECPRDFTKQTKSKMDETFIL